MDAERFKRISKLFEAARLLPDTQREAFLSEACIGDPSIRVEIEELLDEHANQSPLDVSVPGEIAEAVSAGFLDQETTIPRSIVGYTFIKHIGEGGDGISLSGASRESKSICCDQSD